MVFPPLLGTGGNDGRLDFSTNFHQWLLDVIGASTPAAPVRWPSPVTCSTAPRPNSLPVPPSASSTRPARAAPVPRGSARRTPWSTRGATPAGRGGAAVRRQRGAAEPACRRTGRDAVHRRCFPGRVGQRRGGRRVARRGLGTGVVAGLHAGGDQAAVRRGARFLARPPGPARGRLLRGYPHPRRRPGHRRVHPVRAAAPQRARVHRCPARPYRRPRAARGPASRRGGGLGGPVQRNDRPQPSARRRADSRRRTWSTPATGEPCRSPACSPRSPGWRRRSAAAAGPGTRRRSATRPRRGNSWTFSAS